MRIVVYSRVSTGEQVVGGVSLDSQRERLTAWCAAMGHELVETVREEGVSGTVAPWDRPGFHRVRDMLEAGLADGVAVVALDRLSRRVRDVLDLVDHFEARRWTLVALRENLDTGSATGRFIVTVFAALAQLERDLISERTSAALRELKRQGRRCSGVAPWGYRFTEEGTLEPVVSEMSVTMVLGSHPRASNRELADILNGEQIPHPRTGKPWDHRSVWSLRRALTRRG